MAKPSITDARSITADLILEVGKYYSAQQLRSLQAKLSGTAREIRALTSGCHLPRRIGAQLSIEQIQLLQDAAKLIESVNSNIKHAKEKRGRVESQAKVRQQARYAEAKRLVAETYLKPFVSEPADLEPLLEILKTALTLNRADVFRNGLSPTIEEAIVGTKTRRAPQDWLHNLASICSQAFDCSHLAYFNPLLGWSFKFLGKGISPELAAHTYSTLHHQLVAARRAHVAQQKRCQLKTKRHRGQLFAEGWLNAVASKVNQFAGGIDENTALEIQAYLEWHHPKLTLAIIKPIEAKGHDTRSLQAGWDQGKHARLHRGVGQQSQVALGHGGSQ